MNELTPFERLRLRVEGRGRIEAEAIEAEVKAVEAETSKAEESDIIVPETIGSRIRDIRLSKKWSQQKLADRIGSSQDFISEIERDLLAPRISWIYRCAAALNVKSRTLIPKDQ